MNDRQKEIEALLLRHEKDVLKQLESNYTKALADIKKQIKNLMADELTQSKIYQLEYQKALEKQMSAILDMMQTDNFTSIQDYLKACHEDAWFGSFYDLQGQGIPLALPIDQKSVVEILAQSPDGMKLSTRLYKQVDSLKSNVKNEIARGIASGYSYDVIARNLADHTEADYHKSMRIARTEGHRVQSASRHSALDAAKEAGADVVKQWDSSLDKKTRKSHQELDGQIRELDEPFEINGHSAMYPGGFGVASEDINCRCIMLQRARWAVEDGEYTKMDGETGQLVTLKEGEGYKEWKDKLPATATNTINTQKRGHIATHHAGEFTDSKYDLADKIRRDCGCSEARALQLVDDFEQYFDRSYREIRLKVNDYYAAISDRIDAYIYASPKYEGSISRGVSLGKRDVAKLKKDAVIDMQGGISSWTSDPNISAEFAGSDSKKIAVVLKLAETKSGTSVAHLSKYGLSESEVLLPSTTKFRVKSIQEVKNTETIAEKKLVSSGDLRYNKEYEDFIADMQKKYGVDGMWSKMESAEWNKFDELDSTKKVIGGGDKYETVLKEVEKGPPYYEVELEEV